MQIKSRYLLLLFYYIIIIPSTLYSFSIENKYPNYAYVFSEFDVDESYSYDEEFIAFVQKNERKLKRFYKRSLRRGKDVLPMMQGLLVEDGVSDLFIYLSMVESGFINDAVSPKKAVGLWQFMPATARQYNLTVCSAYDERCDAVSATSAAIRYLNKLHRQFGKWYLAAMAYNCGEGCLERAIKRARTDDLSVLTNNHAKYLPKETREYIKKILLVAMIGEDNTFCITDEINNDNDNEVIQVEIRSDSTLKSIAKLLKMDTKKLLGLNKDFREGSLSKNIKKYKISIPLEKMYAFYLRYDIPLDDFEMDNFEKEKEEKNYKSHMITHRVILGDTLEKVSKLYNTDIDDIRVANHLEYMFLTVDTLLVVPVNKQTFENLSP